MHFEPLRRTILMLILFFFLSVSSLQHHAEKNSQWMCGQRKINNSLNKHWRYSTCGETVLGGQKSLHRQSFPTCLDSTRCVLTARKFSSGLALCLALRTCCQIHNSCLIKTGNFILANRRSIKRVDLDLHVPCPLLFHVLCLCLVLSPIVTE